MTWNYRVVRFKDEHAETGEYYEIKEVFYDANGKPVGYSDATCGSDVYDGLFKVMGLMQSAHAKPTLDEAEFFSNKETREGWHQEWVPDSENPWRADQDAM